MMTVYVSRLGGRKPAREKAVAQAPESILHGNTYPPHFVHHHHFGWVRSTGCSQHKEKKLRTGRLCSGCIVRQGLKYVTCP